MSQASGPGGLAKELSLTDAVLLLVGGVIGSGIFLTAGQIAASVKRADMFILVWVAGGVISLLACLAVAELGGMFPTAGSQYVFLREAYGELPAFLYGWVIIAVGQTGAIAAISAGFAQYLSSIAPELARYPRIISVAAIAIVTLINIYGVKRGSILVGAATWAKYAAWPHSSSSDSLSVGARGRTSRSGFPTPPLAHNSQSRSVYRWFRCSSRTKDGLT